MPLEVISAETAWNTASNNQHAKYPSPSFAARRLYPVPYPEGRSSFKINREARIFTMGSCFAREVDVALVNAGFNVTSIPPQLPRAVVGETPNRNLFNKYAVHSILNEVRWALDPAQPHPGEAAFVQVDDDRWTDLQTGGEKVEGSLADMLTFRSAYASAMKNMATADVFILTLGLVEAWYDTQSGLYLNMPPMPAICERWPGRFELHVQDYAEINEALEHIHAYVRHYGKPDVRFLMTVSPVPLRRTFRESDVLLANMYSKAVQRAAVEAFVARHDDTDYFPSYEFVVLADPKTTWTREDYRHLAPALVERIMSRVMAKYAAGSELDPDEAAKEVRRLHLAKDYAKIVDLSKSLDPDELDSRTLLLMATAHKHICDYEPAFELFLKAAARPPVPQAALENAIRLAAILERKDELKVLLRQLSEAFPEAGAAFQKNYAEKPEKTALAKVGEAIAGLFLLLFSIPMVLSGYLMIFFFGLIGKIGDTRACARALGYFLNATLFGGLACESIPSHAWRERHRRWAKTVVAIVDRYQKGYCERANRKEQPFVELAMGKGMLKETLLK